MERPILFSTPMVQAILDGRKTQTRRIMKPQICWSEGMKQWVLYPKQHPTVYASLIAAPDYCPYGKPGDNLWVKETFTVLEPEHILSGKMADRFVFKADMKSKESEDVRQEYIKMGWPYKWKSPLFMPKEACRIRLRIDDIGVERVQDISEKDAIAEGTPESLTIKDLEVVKGMGWIIPSPFQEHQFTFLALWCRINGQQSWLDNPWVWVIKFHKI